MKKKKRSLLRILITLIALLSYQISRWRKTPFGDLHPLMAIMRKVMPSLNREGQSYEKIEAQRRLYSQTPNIIRYGNVETRLIPGPAGMIPVRVITPETEGPHPIIVYFHGGGFVSGNMESHKNLSRRLSKETGSIVIQVEYRLAPEHIFPAAADDSYSATRWAYENAEKLNGDPEKIIVAGDSAGGNLAASVSLRARDEDGPPIAYQILIYPYLTMLDRHFDSREKFENYVLEKSSLDQFSRWYTPSPEMKIHPYASPYEAEDFSNLPAAYVATAEFDVLHDEGLGYFEKLITAGNKAVFREFKGMLHGFFSYVELGGNLDMLLSAPGEVFDDLNILINEGIDALPAESE